MSATDIGSLAGVAGLVALAALVAAAETVLNRFALVRALRLDEEGRRGAAPLVWLLEHRSRALSVVLLVTILARVLGTGLIVTLVLRHLDGASGVAVAVAGMTVLSYVVAEVLPRTLTLRHLEGAALRLAAPASALTRVLGPVAALLIGLGRALVGNGAGVSGPYAPDEELEQAVEDEEDEPLEDGELAMIHSIFELGDTIAREVMVPRPDMATVGEEQPLGAVVESMVRLGFSRVPVHRQSKDDIVGVVYAKDVLELLASDPAADDWHELVRPPTFVPETKRVDELLRELQEQTVHLAIVVDEYGATIGLITIEDILEEIVGEIVDEHDHEEALVEVLDDDRFRVDARLSVSDLNQLCGSALPDEDWDTVGGLLFGTLGRVPRPGDEVNLDGLTLVVERVQGRRISKVVIRRRTPEPEETADTTEVGAG